MTILEIIRRHLLATGADAVPPFIEENARLVLEDTKP